MSQLGSESRGEQGTKEHKQHHTPWKTVKTKRFKPCGTNTEHPSCGKPPQRDTHTPIHQRGFTTSPNSHALNHYQPDLVLGQGLERLGKPPGYTEMKWPCMVKTMFYLSHVNHPRKPCKLPI